MKYGISFALARQDNNNKIVHSLTKFHSVYWTSIYCSLPASCLTANKYVLCFILFQDRAFLFVQQRSNRLAGIKCAAIAIWWVSCNHFGLFGK